MGATSTTDFSGVMRAVSLTQPTASRLATGVTRVFTRANSSPYRGRLAIHAVDRDVPGYPRKAIVGVGNLVAVAADVVWAGDTLDVSDKRHLILPESWRPLDAPTSDAGVWWYVVADAVALSPPLPIAGKSGGIWSVPVDARADVASRLR